jgi:hypothetical protein
MEAAQPNVLQFTKRTDVNVEGPARCIACKREWHAVVPFTNRRLPMECPTCGQMKGTLVGAYVPDGPVWQCGCGNDLVNVLPDGIFCPNCGEFEDMPKNPAS